MTERVFHYLDFTCADEGFPRGACATMKLPDGSFAELFAEPGESIENAIEEWWLEHGRDLVRESGAAADEAIHNMPRITA